MCHENIINGFVVGCERSSSHTKIDLRMVGKNKMDTFYRCILHTFE